MPYFNYHAKVRSLINSNECLGVSIIDKHNKISPAMVFYFKNHKPMPIRQYKWKDYFPLIETHSIPLSNYTAININAIKKE